MSNRGLKTITSSIEIEIFYASLLEILIQRMMERTGAVVVLIMLTFLVASAGNLTMMMTRLILSAAAALSCHRLSVLFRTSS